MYNRVASGPDEDHRVRPLGQDVGGGIADRTARHQNQIE